MTGQEFIQWMEDNDCFNDGPISIGINVKGYALKFRRRKSFLFIYFSGPYDDRTVPKWDIIDACDGLEIPLPPGIRR